MKKPGIKNKPLSSKKNIQNIDFSNNDFEAILNSTDARIWTVDKNYCLVFGNSNYHKEFKQTYNREIKTGESVLLPELLEKDKADIKSFYDRAKQGERFTFEHKRSYSDELKWNIYHFGPLQNKSGEIIGASVLALDITDKVTAKKELKHSNKRFEELVDLLPEGVFEVDKNLKITYVNQHIVDMTGYSNSDFQKGMNAFELLAPADRELAAKTFERRFKGEDISAMEYEVVRKDGSIFPILFHASSIIKEGKLIGVRGVIIDITERKKAEVALKESEERYRNVVDVSPDAIIIHCEGKIVFTNKAAIQLVGGSEPNDLLGKSALDIVHPDDRKLALTRIKNLLTSGEPAPLFEERMIKLDGSVINTEVVAVRTFYNEKPASLVVLRDITKRKLAQEQQHRMAQMLDLAPNSIIIHDFDGNIFFANKKAFEFHGYSKEEFSNFSLGDLSSPESKKHIPRRMNLIKKEGHSSFQVEHFRKDGTILPLEVSTVTTKWNDKDAVISIGSDITERRNHEKALQQSEEKFKNIFMNSVVGMSITDLVGNLSVNKAFSQIVGYSEDELNNSKWGKITHPEDIDNNQEIFESIIAGEKETARWEKRYIHKNGNIIWVDISTTLQHDNNGKPQYFITTIIDITEKKLAEEKLFSSQQILEGIFNTMHVRIFWKDKDLNYMGCNQTFANDTGFSNPKEIIGKNDSQLAWHEQAEIYNADDIQVIKSGIPKLNIEEPQTTPDGQKITLLTNKIPLLDSENKVSGVLGTYMDITKRRQDEEKLIESEERFRSLYENSTIGIYRASPDGKILMANPALAKMLLFESSEELCKRNLETNGFKQSYERKEFIERIEKERVIFGMESIWNRKNNTPIYVRESARAISDPNGKTLYYDGTVENITERKEAEIKLQESYNLLNNLTSMVPGVVYQYRLYPDGHSTFPYSSPGMYDIYEVTSEEVKEDASPVFTRIHPDDYDNIVETINESAQKLTVYHSEFRVILPKQGLRWRLCDAKPERLEDGSTLWYGIISDITERKNAENEIIKAKEKAEESDRLKSAFLANMSHEIRTPMNGIMGFSSLLKEPYLSGEEQNKYIEIIEKSGKRMLNTINDIIDISKIEAGQVEISISEFNIAELFENTLSFFKLDADKKGLKILSSNNLTEKEIVIRSDKEKLNAVLTNLVKNAIKFCDKGMIEIGCSRKNNFIEFYVKDTGKGIPHDRLDAIFERFVQADIEDRDAKEGSGLGLAIAKSYVELMGGKIWVESKKDVGSTFYFTIPFTLSKFQQNKKSAENESAENKIKGLNILIAEDDQVSEFLTKLMIEKISDKILMARTGVEAIELCKNNPDLDLILMDIKMPVMDGYEATRKIREFNNNVIIIATTAFALTGDKEKALEAGCTDYLTKPLSQKSLDELLKLYF